MNLIFGQYSSVRSSNKVLMNVQFPHRVDNVMTINDCHVDHNGACHISSHHAALNAECEYGILRRFANCFKPSFILVYSYFKGVFCGSDGRSDTLR